MKLPRIALALLVLAPPAAFAATAPKASPSSAGFSGKGQLGFVASQGNAQGKSGNAAIRFAYVSGPWKHVLRLAMLYGQSLGVVSAERWRVAWQSNRKISSRAFAFGALRYEHDMFDGFQYQGSAAAGIGYTVIHSKSVTLSTQIGAGYTVSRPETLTHIPLPNSTRIFIERTPLARQNYAIGTLGVDYDQKLTAVASLTDKLLTNAGTRNVLVTNDLAFVVKVSTRLAMSLGYDVQENTHPPAGIDTLDSTETVNLVYAF